MRPLWWGFLLLDVGAGSRSLEVGLRWNRAFGRDGTANVAHDHELGLAQVVRHGAGLVGQAELGRRLGDGFAFVDVDIARQG